MGMIDVNRNPSRRQLNQFGAIWLVFFAAVAAVLWFKLHSLAVTGTVAFLAAVVPAVGWVAPAFMRLVYVGMSYLAWPIGFVVSHVLLAAVFYLLVTPIGLIMRLVGYDPMHRRFEPEAASYWIARDGAVREPKSYFRQF
jgi:hypothetical protein